MHGISSRGRSRASAPYAQHMDVGPAELLIILAVVLLVFGSKKLPELARGMGQAATEFRKGLHSSSEDGDASTPGDAPLDGS
jgi:sec-independent protein translocase protein TatA